MTSVARAALVTGAARGIGAATVRRLADDGFHVIAVDSCAADTADDMPGVAYTLASEAELAAVVGHAPDRITALTCDVRDLAALRAGVDAVVHDLGRLDAVVAAAAVISGGRPLWETPQDDMHLLMDVDFVGVWNTAAVCVPHLLAAPDPHLGRFVAVASAAGEQGLFGLTAYCAAKHAVIGLVRGLAADLVGTGATAVAVSPGSTSTDMLHATASIYGLDDVTHLEQRQLLRRSLAPEEIAATIAFCCSPEGAALNGSVVSATGGFSA